MGTPQVKEKAVNEELENIVQLHEHSKTFPKCVVLDRNNDVFLIQASPNTLMTDGEDTGEPILVAVTVDLDDADMPMLFAVNLFGEPASRPGARTPAFPLQVLANR